MHIKSLGFREVWPDFVESLSISGNGVHPEDKSRNLLPHGRRRRASASRKLPTDTNFKISSCSSSLSLCHQREVLALKQNANFASATFSSRRFR